MAKSQIQATKSLPSRSAPGCLVAAQLSLVGSMVQIASEGDGETLSIDRRFKTGERAEHSRGRRPGGKRGSTARRDPVGVAHDRDWGRQRVLELELTT